MQATSTIDSAEKASQKAVESTMLSPRFYTTDFAAMNKLDMSPMRAEWDKMMAEYEGDNNHDHFQRDAEFAKEVAERFSQVSPEMRQEFLRVKGLTVLFHRELQDVPSIGSLSRICDISSVNPAIGESYVYCHANALVAVFRSKNPCALFLARFLYPVSIYATLMLRKCLFSTKVGFSGQVARFKGG